MNWLKKFLQGKITINIVVDSSSDITRTTEPREIIEKPIVNVIRKSDYRFVSEKKNDVYGNETLYYFTERYDHKYERWGMVSNTFFSDKEHAMNAHLKLLELGTLDPVITKTIYWEGLSKEETAAWVTLNK